ncbi:MAG TPA: hypothetical protein VFT74_18350 [Isosphaeraceae bacterium]|nr:hypothetical protein [Isosphaeraceae bacterium]
MNTPNLTDEAAQEHEIKKAGLLWSLSQGLNRSAAASSNGVPRRTLYNWLESDESFRLKVEEAEHLVVDEMEALAHTCARRAGEDPRYLRALFFWLKCNAGWIEARPTQEEAQAVPNGPARTSGPKRPKVSRFTDAEAEHRPAHADPGLHMSDLLFTNTHPERPHVRPNVGARQVVPSSKHVLPSSKPAASSHSVNPQPATRQPATAPRKSIAFRTPNPPNTTRPTRSAPPE